VIPPRPGGEECPTPSRQPGPGRPTRVAPTRLARDVSHGARRLRDHPGFLIARKPVGGPSSSDSIPVGKVVSKLPAIGVITSAGMNAQVLGSIAINARGHGQTGRHDSTRTVDGPSIPTGRYEAPTKACADLLAPNGNGRPGGSVGTKWSKRLAMAPLTCSRRSGRDPRLPTKGRAMHDLRGPLRNRDWRARQSGEGTQEHELGAPRHDVGNARRPAWADAAACPVTAAGRAVAKYRQRMPRL
jgi:hypothetical protein